MPYPRPSALPPAFAPTAAPPALWVTGSVIALWDGGGELSRDAVAVRATLSTLGIPSRPIASLAELRSHDVAVLTGALTSDTIDGPAGAQIAAALDAGTTVLAVAPSAPRLYALAGVRSGRYGDERTSFALTGIINGATNDLRAAAPARLVIASSPGAPGRGFQPTSGGGAEVLATFEDGSAALLRRGRLYLLGLKAQYHANLLAGGGYGLSGDWTNVYRIEGDLLPLVLRGLYRAQARAPQLRLLSPGGHRAAVILTHDTDSGRSHEVVQRFLDIEGRHGVKATYLVPTMPYRDGRLGVIYSRELITTLAGALAASHDVGSHSFGHYPDFARLPARLGGESAGTYEPSFAHGHAVDASQLGELQVSRWLLRTDLGSEIAAFRPGHLYGYEGYYEDLATAGYRRSSVRTTGVVRTNLPYRGLRRTASGYAVSPVVEYPIAVSDNDLDGGNVDATVAAWLQVVDKNLITGAPTMLLLHPTTGPGKVEALEAFLAGLATRDVWVGDLASYGEFYESQGF